MLTFKAFELLTAAAASAQVASTSAGINLPIANGNLVLANNSNILNNNTASASNINENTSTNNGSKHLTDLNNNIISPVSSSNETITTCAPIDLTNGVILHKELQNNKQSIIILQNNLANTVSNFINALNLPQSQVNIFWHF